MIGTDDGIKKAGGEGLSPLWRYGVLIVFVLGFGVLIWITAGALQVWTAHPGPSSGPKRNVALFR